MSSKNTKNNAARIAHLSLSASILLAASLSHAESRPLWEIGAGVGAISLPDYRGADSTSSYLLPVPYFVYRGKVLKADRNGVRGTLFNNDQMEVNLSLNATLPVHSKDNVARSGMPDLRPTVEIGPTANFHLWRSSNQNMRLDFRAPLRAAVTLESSPRTVGWLFSPNLNLDVRDPAGMRGWNLGMQTGPVINSRRYNDYFYSVAPTYATAQRPSYSAPGGYAGTQVTMSLSKRFPKYWVGSFLRYDNLGGATFADSPLVKRRSSLAAGIAIAWVFGESSTRVDIDADQ